MAVTPRKLVHWDIDDASLSGLGSPFFNGSVESVISTSSMEYINSQLVAHGFISSPGLALEGISNSDLDRAAKCLLGMLSQRMEDMSRTEELSTKLRTLSYDNERLRSMHQTAMERAANAEREMNVHKSRLAAATRTLQTTEAAHKHTTAELQRTRTTLLGIKATHQSELKKKEKDIERMTDKWSKVADAQAKLMSIPSGLKCANAAVVDGSEMLGKGLGYLEVALEEAEKSRRHLTEESVTLRKLVLTAVNEIQAILHQAMRQPAENEATPTPFTLSTLFPLYPEGNANDKLNFILVELRACLAAASQTIPAATSKIVTTTSDEEVERLQGIIVTLKDEREKSQKQLAVQAAETQSMLDKFLEDHRNMTNDIGEMSVELMTVPLRDEEKERMENIKKDLDVERQKFTDAAIKLGKERAELEAERLKLLDEKRSWQVEMMLAELPPTPHPAVPTPRVAAARLSPRKLQSPRRSPAKVCVGKAGSSIRKATRVSRRSLASPAKIIPAYETEVLPPIPAPTFHVEYAPLGSSLLPTSFVLPPPSPHASLPTQPALPPPASSPEAPQSPPSVTAVVSPPLTSGAPSTPLTSRRLFPVAKPFAQRMIHAYSPAKPSPLSRILLLGNSPSSPDGVGTGSDSDISGLLQPVTEEDENNLGFEQFAISGQGQSEVSLAAELGVESPPESPLQEKKLEPNVVVRQITTAGAKTAKGRVLYPDPKRFTAKEKGKGKAMTGAVSTQARVKTSAAVEKENATKSSQCTTKVSKVSPPGLGSTETKKVVKPPPKPTASMTGSRARLLAKLPPPAKTGGGPRRVLVDSVEAPVIGKGWKG